MGYVDGLVVPVPKSGLRPYRLMAGKAGKVRRERGALEIAKCVGDVVKRGKNALFPQSMKLNPGETVVFSYIVYKSRAHCDRASARRVNGSRLAAMMDAEALTFGGRRLIYDGFEVLTDA